MQPLRDLPIGLSAVQKRLAGIIRCTGQDVSARRLIEGQINKADEIFKFIDYCILCGRCKRECPSGVKTDEIFLRAKGILRQVKKMPLWQKAVLKFAMGQPKMLAAMSPLFHMGLRLGTKKSTTGFSSLTTSTSR